MKRNSPKRMHRALRIWTVGAVAAALALTGCTSSGGQSEQAEKAVFSLASAPRSMDIAHGSDVNSLRAIGVALDRLVTLDDDGGVIPWIATSWTQPDPLSYVFTIRSDVKFWDGSDLTTEDVAFSLRRQIDPATASETAANFASVASVEPTDGNTVTVTLTQPDSGFLYKAALAWVITQKQYVEQAGADYGTPSEPGMGTGAYSISDFSTADGITFERSDDYWGEAPALATLELSVIADPDTTRLALSSEQIQGAFDVPLSATRTYDSLDTIAMSYVDAPNIDFLSMDVTKAPFDDPNVRLAMAHLADREGLLGALFNDRATVANSIVPSSQLAATVGADDLQSYYSELPAVPAFDVDEAKTALAASSHASGFTVTLPLDSSQPWMQSFAQNFAQNAQEVGITIQPEPMAPAAWLANLTSADASALQLFAGSASTPNPSEVPLLLLGDATYNIAHYNTPEMTAELQKLQEAPDVETAMPSITSILTMVGDDLPYVPLYSPQGSLALSTSLTWRGGYSVWALSQPWALSVEFSS